MHPWKRRSLPREKYRPGCTVYCAVSDNPNRKTKFDLIAVEKKVESSTLLINMDSQAPNAAVKEWLASGASPFGQIDLLKPECRHGNSRFDFYLECKSKNTVKNVQNSAIGLCASADDSKTDFSHNLRKIFIEVKGVTLEDDGVVLFPDAPTERGVKHVHELIQCHGEGYETYILFVVQMERARYFTPNRKTHPEFADALCEAKQADVELLAYVCTVSPDEMKLDKPLEIKL